MGKGSLSGDKFVSTVVAVKIVGIDVINVVVMLRNAVQVMRVENGL